MTSVPSVPIQHVQFNDPDNMLNSMRAHFKTPMHVAVGISKSHLVVTWAMPKTYALTINEDLLALHQELNRQQGLSVCAEQARTNAYHIESQNRSLSMNILLDCVVTALKLPVGYIWTAKTAQELLGFYKEHNEAVHNKTIVAEKFVPSKIFFVNNHCDAGGESWVYGIKMWRGNGNIDLLKPVMHLWDSLGINNAHAAGETDIRMYSRGEVLAGFIDLLYREKVQGNNDTLHFLKCPRKIVNFVDYRMTPPMHVKSPTHPPDAWLRNVDLQKPVWDALHRVRPPLSDLNEDGEEVERSVW